MTTNRCHVGDCRDVMRMLIDAGVRVQTIVTSPPYWGLRDYGHPGQIGLEQTPEQYVAAMVDVFRCVWDVLADDGTLWLNLGSSYASGDKTPSQSLLRQRVPPCGTRGTAPQDSQGAGRACLGSYDEPQGETRCHRENNAHICRCDEQVEPQIEPTSQGNERLGCDQSSRLTFQPGDHQSTTDATSQNVQDALHPSGEALAYQRAPRTSLRDAQEFSDKSACTCGTSRMLQPLAVHTKGKESFFSACRRSDCNGIGRCGYCFGSLTTASLNIKQKDELNIPHLVAMALQADGWVLRQTICWSKPNPMPESVRDRCTKAHEYLFLMSKSPRYYFDQDAIKEPAASVGGYKMPDGWDTGDGGHGSFHRNGREKGKPSGTGVGWGYATGEKPRTSRAPGNVNPAKGQAAFEAGDERHRTKAGLLAYAERSRRDSFKREAKEGERPNQTALQHREARADDTWDTSMRNKRSVWTIATEAFKEAHFATFPQALVEPCILAGSRPGDIVFDPFMGSGTVAAVSQRLGRRWIGAELNPEYVAMQAARTRQLGLELAA